MPDRTFRVRIKLDSEESTRRLRSLEKKMGFSRNYVIELIRMVDIDGKLQNELQLAEQQICTTVELLELAQVEEREYMAEGVLVVEAGFGKLRELLRQLDRCVDKELPVPSGCYLLASSLANELYSERTGLYRLRKAFEHELAAQRARSPRGLLKKLVDHLLTAMEMLCDPRPEASTHYETEHIYSCGWCKCREYV